ncbi:hypothetical protein DFJ77DRAFT_143599 [Powellomyces hirtus]|nr:hypothetical protein DFJ77DRAFT_143599 [Powellomyces hirtus]
MHITALFTVAVAALATAATANPTIAIRLANSDQVQVLGDGGVNAEGCFNVYDDADPAKQAGVAHARVSQNDIAAFFYTAPDCVRDSRIFAKTVREARFTKNALLARSIRLINPALQKAPAGASGVNAWNSWKKRHAAARRETSPDDDSFGTFDDTEAYYYDQQ